MPYREIINEVLIGNVNCEAAVEFTTRLQSRLLTFYRKGSLLFHPDKIISKEWGNELTPLCNALSLKYKKYLLDESLAELSRGTTQLEEYLNQFLKKDTGSETSNKIYEKLKKTIDQLVAKRHAFLEEVKEKLRVQEAKLEEREEKLNQLFQLMERMEISLASKTSNQSKEAESEDKSIKDENKAEEQRFYFKP